MVDSNPNNRHMLYSGVGSIQSMNKTVSRDLPNCNILQEAGILNGSIQLEVTISGTTFSVFIQCDGTYLADIGDAMMRPFRNGFPTSVPVRLTLHAIAN